MSLEDNARRAREAGLSYGKYMALYGKTPEQVTREAEARKLGDADRVIRRNYAHAERREGAAPVCCCLNCGDTFSSKRPKKFCSRFCYSEYYRRRAYEREAAKLAEQKPGSVPVNLDRLRQEMSDRKLSHKKMAELAGCGESTISNIMCGRGARWSTLEKLADALGIKPDELIQEDKT